MKKAISIDGPNGKLFAMLSLPDDTHPLSMAVCFHGGPGGDHTGNAGGYDEIAQTLAKRGHGCLQVDFFGSGSSDGGPSDWSIATQVADQRAAIDYIRENYKCPFHIFGESTGGTIVSSDWQSDASSYILLWPAFDLAWTDLQAFLTDEWKEKVAKEGLLRDGDFVMSKSLFDEILTNDFSANFNLPDLPVLLVHGGSDEEVPLAQSLKAMKTACNELCYFTLPEADHGFKSPDARKKLLSIVEYWVCDRQSAGG